MRAFIVVGDKAANGAVVISGATGADIGGKRIARQGDRVSCAGQCRRGTCTILSGDPGVLVEGRPVARHGDTTACGAALIAGQVATHTR